MPQKDPNHIDLLLTQLEPTLLASQHESRPFKGSILQPTTEPKETQTLHPKVVGILSQSEYVFLEEIPPSLHLKRSIQHHIT